MSTTCKLRKLKVPLAPIRLGSSCSGPFKFRKSFLSFPESSLNRSFAYCPISILISHKDNDKVKSYSTSKRFFSTQINPSQNINSPSPSPNSPTSNNSNANDDSNKPKPIEQRKKISLSELNINLTSSLLSKEADLIAKIRRPRPLTPGQRNVVKIDKSELWNRGPYRPLTAEVRKKGGRNNSGRITAHHRGGGHKRRYRFIDFKRNKFDQPATVVRLEYDPNRSAYIALVRYPDNEVRYILAPQDLVPGTVIMSSRSQQLDISPGNSMPISTMPLGTIMHNLELKPGRGGQLARSAGTYCQLIEKSTSKAGYALVQMASLEQRYILLTCLGTIGSLSNPLHKIVKLGKAGANRWRGWRPHVRANVKNPVDHPMGGGHNAKGRQPCSPTGVLAKGFKTVKKKSKMIVVPRGGITKGEAKKSISK